MQKIRKVYISVVLIMLIVPLLFINLKEQQVSEIDNMMLMELSEVGANGDITEGLEQYIRERIGFREVGIRIYAKLNDAFFHYSINPRTMYGKEDHMFFADKTYTDDYQHLNMDTEKELCDSFVRFLDRTDKYCASKGADFIYWLIPDKKAIYEEFFPDEYNVCDNQARIDYYLDVLDKSDIRYVYPLDALLERKDDLLLYYKQYDPAHWNGNGSFVGHKELSRALHLIRPEVEELNEKDFYVDEYMVKSAGALEIQEQAYFYHLKEEPNVLDKSDENPLNAHARYFSHFVNEEAQTNLKMLVFCDSYLYNSEGYWYNQFSEVIYLHNARNVSRIQEFIDYYEPDIVIFENVERVISVDYSVEMLDSIVFE